MQNFFSFFLNFIYLFWLCWVLAWALFSCGERGHSLPWCLGFSPRWLLLLPSTGSRQVGFSSCGSRAPERRLSSCGTRAQLLCGMWNPLRPGLEPVSPALSGRLLTAVPVGKSRHIFNFDEIQFMYFFFCCLCFWCHI